MSASTLETQSLLEQLDALSSRIQAQDKEIAELRALIVDRKARPEINDGSRPSFESGLTRRTVVRRIALLAMAALGVGAVLERDTHVATAQQAKLSATATDGIAVYGEARSGTGVVGVSQTGSGLIGQASDGIAIQSKVIGSGKLFSGADDKDKEVFSVDRNGTLNCGRVVIKSSGDGKIFSVVTDKNREVFWIGNDGVVHMGSMHSLEDPSSAQ